MLPSLGFQEIVLLGIIALVVVGPKDLPLLLRKLGKWTAKLRGMAQEFRTGFDELARQAELDELRKEVDALRRTTNLTSVTNELQRPLGTLESYAGISPPPPPPAPVAAEASSSMEEEAQSGGGDAPSGTNDGVSRGAPFNSESTPPQSSLRDDNSSIEEAHKEPAVRSVQ